MKEEYLASGKIVLQNIPVQGLYKLYSDYCENRKITPLAKVVVIRTLSNELNITSTRVYINGSRTRVYNISKKKLCKKFLTKNWIHETDEIDEVEVPNISVSDLKALDQFLSKIYPTTSFQPIVESKVKENKKPCTKKG